MVSTGRHHYTYFQSAPRASPRPGSWDTSEWKTTLMYLLHRHIVHHRKLARVLIYRNWSRRQLESNPNRLADKLPGYPDFAGEEQLFFFDEAQTTYWDNSLWEAFKDTIQIKDKPVYAILFCSHGHEDTSDKLTLPDITAKVTLYRSSNHGSNPNGLLLDTEESRDLIKRQAPKPLFENEFHDFVYQLTQGHIGHTMAVVRFVIEKMPICDGLKLDLYQDTTPYDRFCRYLTKDIGFGCGLPRDPRLYAQAIRMLLREESIYRYDESIPEHIRSNLQDAYEWGFIEIDEAKRYVFLSPLLQQLPFADLFSLVKATVSRFRHSQLTDSNPRVSASNYRPPEAQYKVECYRCVHDLTTGNVRITPEYAAATGTRPDRIDFFIPSEKWGIELTCDGEGLAERSTRFQSDDAYEQWLRTSEMKDYILLDFCKIKPTQSQPGIKNLHYVTFDTDATSFEIYDNNLTLRAGGYHMMRFHPTCCKYVEYGLRNSVNIVQLY